MQHEAIDLQCGNGINNRRCHYKHDYKACDHDPSGHLLITPSHPDRAQQNSCRPQHGPGSGDDEPSSSLIVTGGQADTQSGKSRNWNASPTDPRRRDQRRPRRRLITHFSTVSRRPEEREAIQPSLTTRDRAIETPAARFMLGGDPAVQLTGLVQPSLQRGLALIELAPTTPESIGTACHVQRKHTSIAQQRIDRAAERLTAHRTRAETFDVFAQQGPGPEEVAHDQRISVEGHRHSKRPHADRHAKRQHDHGMIAAGEPFTAIVTAAVRTPTHQTAMNTEV